MRLHINHNLSEFHTLAETFIAECSIRKQFICLFVYLFVEHTTILFE